MEKSALQLGESVERGKRAWINQKIAVFLGDYEDGREPKRDPSPCRAATRILFLGVLFIVYVLLLAYYFHEAPEVKVVQIQHLGPGEKHHNYPIEMLYDRKPLGSYNGSFNESYGGRTGVQYNSSRSPLSCPCTTTSVQWRKYVSFNTLTSSLWNMSWIPSCKNDLVPGRTGPCVQIPPQDDYYVSLLQNDIVADPHPLDGSPGETSICDSSTLWNVTDNTFPFYNPPFTLNTSFVECYWLASMLFYSTSLFSESSSTETKSTDILDTPMLLDRETFFMRVAGVAREAVLKRRLRLNEMHGNDVLVQKYYDTVADYLTELLDRGELDEYWQSFYEGAYYLQESANVSMAYEPNNALVFFVGFDILNPTFLHVRVNWTQYYETCAPKYCERTQNMKRYQQAIKALATVGGLSSFALAMISLVLWPAVGLFLNLCRNKSSAAQPDFPL